MKGRSLFALPILVLAFGCGEDRQPMGPRVPIGSSEIISDGAHGGNPDFFFLPPMVPPPFQHPDFERGAFNPRIQPSLKIVICELVPEPLDARPTPATACAAKDPVKTFAPGTVNLVGVPPEQSGWWSTFDLPLDGFYHALWDTRQSADLALDKYYRIKVSINGSATSPDVTLGYADVDPVSNMKEWRHALTGEVVTLIDDSKLPIVFRVENSALCGGAELCTSVTVTNNNDGVDQIVQLDNAGQDPIAGASIPDCVLPGPDCPLPGGEPAPAGAIQSFVLNISRVPTGGSSGFASNASNTNVQSAPTVCHPPPFPLQQFEGCFNFTTIPELPAINEDGDVFLNAVTVAVCFELYGNTTDPRVDFVRLFASDPGETPRLLPQASETAILTDPESRDCTSPVIASSSTGVIGLASAGWRKLQGGLGRLFGVKTAYALDVGIAGFVKKISNVGPALVAEIESNSSDDEPTVQPGVATEFSARILGVAHDEDHPSTGLPNMPVDFSLSECNGSLAGDAPSSPTVLTNVDGVAQVSLTVTSGTCTLTATGQAFGDVTFTATVPALPDLVISSGAPVITPSTISSAGGTINFSAWTIRNQGAAFLLGDNLVENGFYLSTDPVITTADTYLNDNNFNSTELEPAGGFFNWGGPTFTIPPLSPGVYYVGILVDRANVVAESDEGNNYVSAQLTVTGVSIDGVLSAGEWTGATTFNFTANVPGEGTTPATLFVMNNAENLYLAVRFARTIVDAGDNRLQFEFDANNDGLGPAIGDDYFVFQHTSISVFSDAFRSSGGVTNDTQRDGAGAFGNDGTHSVYEISHPLNTGQAGQDFALTAGSTIGLFLQLIIGNVGTTFPGPFIEYTPITITGLIPEG
ncbi:MAG: hypothetical protein WD802_02760 [Gemmatimonadaceae bacterium]